SADIQGNDRSSAIDHGVRPTVAPRALNAQDIRSHIRQLHGAMRPGPMPANSNTRRPANGPLFMLAVIPPPPSLQLRLKPGISQVVVIAIPQYLLVDLAGAPNMVPSSAEPAMMPALV